MVKIGLAFLTAVLLLNLVTGSRGLPAVMEARRDFEREEQALSRVRADNNAVRGEIKRLLSDREAIEDLARSELHYIAPGEKLFIIKDVTPPDATPDVPAPAPPAPQPPAPPQN